LFTLANSCSFHIKSTKNDKIQTILSDFDEIQQAENFFSLSNTTESFKNRTTELQIFYDQLELL